MQLSETTSKAWVQVVLMEGELCVFTNTHTFAQSVKMLYKGVHEPYWTRPEGTTDLEVIHPPASVLRSDLRHSQKRQFHTY